jgi:hypothetical protein
VRHHLFGRRPDALQLSVHNTSFQNSCRVCLLILTIQESTFSLPDLHTHRLGLLCTCKRICKPICLCVTHLYVRLYMAKACGRFQMQAHAASALLAAARNGRLACQKPPWNGVQATHIWNGVQATHIWNGVQATHIWNGVQATHICEGNLGFRQRTTQC